MHKRSLSVYGPRENWGEGTNKTERKEMREFLSQFLCTQNVGTLTTKSRSFILTEVVSVTTPDAGA